MEKQDFKIGDVVVLNSGSPKFTVHSIGESLVYVIYYDESKSQLSQPFDIPIECITKILTDEAN